MGIGVLAIGLEGSRGSVDWDIEVDRPYVFPCPVVSFALGLYDVTVQLSSLVDNSPWNVLVICRRPEYDFLAWAWLWKLSGTMGTIEVGPLCLLLG